MLPRSGHLLHRLHRSEVNRTLPPAATEIETFMGATQQGKYTLEVDNIVTSFPWYNNKEMDTQIRFGVP